MIGRHRHHSIGYMFVIVLPRCLSLDTSAQSALERLHECQENMEKLTIDRFDRAVTKDDVAGIHQFTKLFPLIGKSDQGLERYGRYLCTVIRKKCDALISISEMSSSEKPTSTVTLLTSILDAVASVFNENKSIVLDCYG